ncbi:hypothetical protein LCGC14_0341190 [marine sediment metagenome]|uniref:Uncharacterized protein n=1 Tax=marine sediment metagenome TaxID=412755 RepID=A0A0F9TWP5_9ZZZZ
MVAGMVITTRVFEYVTIEELVKKTGLSSDVVNRIYNGGEITEAFIEAVLRCLNEPLDHLFIFKARHEE